MSQFKTVAIIVLALLCSSCGNNRDPQPVQKNKTKSTFEVAISLTFEDSTEPTSLDYKSGDCGNASTGSYSSSKYTFSMIKLYL